MLMFIFFFKFLWGHAFLESLLYILEDSFICGLLQRKRVQFVTKLVIVVFFAYNCWLFHNAVYFLRSSDARLYTHRRLMRPVKLSFVMRRSRRITKDSSSRRIIPLVPVFILETHNQTNYKCLPKFVQTDNASLVYKTANVRQRRIRLSCLYLARTNFFFPLATLLLSNC